MNKKIAIIGGGMAGLTAGYLLHRNYDLTLFERSGRLGGNAFTLATPDGHDVDIAAAVFGRDSYRNLFRLFERLGIRTVGPSSVNRFGLSGLGVSFCDLDSRQGLFLTPGLRALVSQNFRIFKPRNLRTILQFMAGLKAARELLHRGKLEGLSLEEAFPMIPGLTGDAKLMFVSCLCLITSMHCDDVLDGPAAFFAEKLDKHHDFMPPGAFFSVRLTTERTRSYVEALSKPYREKIVLNAEIGTVIRNNGRVAVRMADGRESVFDGVIFACNADQALRMLDQPTPEEQRLLGAWRYREGRVVVHRDHAQFPKRELMEGYTFLYRKQGRYIDTSVSGSLWVLPGASRTSDLISTQHPNFPIKEDLVLFEKVFRTPIFDFRSCRTQRELPFLNGARNTYYCGSHFGFGLHEDAVTSAMEVAEKLGGAYGEPANR
jgi:predicted NAD/FAD-binding protein